MSFLIVVCGKCGGFLLAKAGQKTRTCPYCGFRVELCKAKKVGSAKNAYEASELLRSLKKDFAEKRGSVSRSRV
jgi:DNA-directed RNA polymerase subunit RPC12/RpoP